MWPHRGTAADRLTRHGTLVTFLSEWPHTPSIILYATGCRIQTSQLWSAVLVPEIGALPKSETTSLMSAHDVSDSEYRVSVRLPFWTDTTSEGPPQKPLSTSMVPPFFNAIVRLNPVRSSTQLFCGPSGSEFSALSRSVSLLPDTSTLVAPLEPSRSTSL